MCFERLLQAFARWQPGILFDIAAQPILEYRWIGSYSQCPCEHSSKLQLSIRFTPSRCLDVRQDWYPMYYPEEMKARVSPVQSIKPHKILAPTRDSNQEPPGPQSGVVTTILPLHTSLTHCSHVFLLRLRPLVPSTTNLLQADTQSSTLLRSRCPNHLNLPRLATSATQLIPRRLHKSSLRFLSFKDTPHIHLTIIRSVFPNFSVFVYISLSRTLNIWTNHFRPKDSAY